MSKTIDEVKEDKRMLEEQIYKLIAGFSQRNKVKVDYINISTAETISGDGITMPLSVSLDVSL
jgi:hypothetical protein